MSCRNMAFVVFYFPEQEKSDEHKDYCPRSMVWHYDLSDSLLGMFSICHPLYHR